jgi:hypothetical protein
LMIAVQASCVSARVWVVDSWPGRGGVIGYRGRNHAEISKRIDNAAWDICPSGRWKIVRDTLQASQRQGVIMMPQTTTTQGYLTGNFGTVYGQATTSGSTPVPFARTDYWREAEVSCSQEVPPGAF